MNTDKRVVISIQELTLAAAEQQQSSSKSKHVVLSHVYTRAKTASRAQLPFDLKGMEEKRLVQDFYYLKSTLYIS